MPETSASVEHAQKVLAEQCHNLRTQPHWHVSLTISAAERTAELVAKGLLDHDHVRTALLNAAQEYINDRQCHCSRDSVLGYIDAAIDAATRGAATPAAS